MRWYRPRSFFALVLLGFSFAVVPLVIGLINAAATVNALREQSQRVVYRAVQATEDSRLLFQRVVVMERNAKQYFVLNDPMLLAAYRDARRQFRLTAQALTRLHLDAKHSDTLTRLINDEQKLYAALTGAKSLAQARMLAANGFGALIVGARAVGDESNRLIEREVKQVQKEARRAERLLAWQAFALIPGTLAFTALFTYLI